METSRMQVAMVITVQTTPEFGIFPFQSLGVGGGRREEGRPAEKVSRREIIRRSAIQGVVGQDIFLPERSIMREKHGHIYQVSGGCGE